MELQNACLLVAMRKLLGDEYWGPKDICEIIIEHNGFPGNKNVLLPFYAPVEVWDENVNVYGDDEKIIIPNGDHSRSITIPSTDLIIISYATRPGRAHFLCIPALKIFSIKKKIYVVITKKEG